MFSLKKINDDLPASSLTKEMIQDYQREQEEEDFYVITESE